MSGMKTFEELIGYFRKVRWLRRNGFAFYLTYLCEDHGRLFNVSRVWVKEETGQYITRIDLLRMTFAEMIRTLSGWDVQP